MRASKALGFSAAVAVGVVTGWYLAGRHVQSHRAALFSKNRWRRMAALSYLAGQRGPDTVRLLKDYIAWEPIAMLKRRAARIVGRMEAGFRLVGGTA